MGAKQGRTNTLAARVVEVGGFVFLCLSKIKKKEIARCLRTISHHPTPHQMQKYYAGTGIKLTVLCYK